MKLQALAITVFGLFALPLHSADLPLDVLRVLNQLEEFEAEERAKAEQTIVAKRAQVAKFLQKALDRETKAGNLDEALLIKAKIESLNPEKPAEPSSIPVAGGNRDFIGEWTWFIPDQKLLLEKGGKAFIQLPGGGAKLEAKWQEAGDSGRSITVNWGDNEARIKFDAAFAKGDIKGKNGGNEFSTELKRIK